MVKVVSWYDNEWAYSTRIVDLVNYVSRNMQLVKNIQQVKYIVQKMTKTPKDIANTIYSNYNKIY